MAPGHLVGAELASGTLVWKARRLGKAEWKVFSPALLPFADIGGDVRVAKSSRDAVAVELVIALQKTILAEVAFDAIGLVTGVDEEEMGSE